MPKELKVKKKNCFKFFCKMNAHRSLLEKFSLCLSFLKFKGNCKYEF